MTSCGETRIRRLHVSDDYLIALGEYSQKKDSGDKFVNLLTKRRYTIKDTESSYRAINHWASQGLIDDAREDKENGWRRL